MDAIAPGATGAAVEDVQRRLVVLGHTIGDPFGSFGPDTEFAVRRFQQERRLAADGIVGSDTWGVLVDAGWRLGDRLLYLTQPNLRGDDVRELQRALSRLGFDTGSSDGVHGPETDTGLRDFQHNIGIPVDGIAGPTTLALLRSMWRRHQEATSFEVLERHATTNGPGSLVALRVVIDPARGPGDPGPRLVGDALHEADVTLDIAHRLRGMLAARGAHALLTRAATSTPGSAERASFANEVDADVVVSIALASTEQTAARGVCAHYFGDGEVDSARGLRLAELVTSSISRELHVPDCRAHASMSTMLRLTKAPTVVVEVGFASNPHDAAALGDSSWRHGVAMTLAHALQAWVDPTSSTAADAA